MTTGINTVSRTPQYVLSVLVNLLPLAGVFYLHWSAWHLLLIYLAEYMSSGFITLMKIYRSGPYKTDVDEEFRQLITVFLTLFGLMWHFIFIFAIGSIVMHVSPDVDILQIQPGPMAMKDVISTYHTEDLLYPVIAIVLYQLYQYFSDFIGNEKYKRGYSGLYFLLLAARPFGLVIFLSIAVVLFIILSHFMDFGGGTEYALTCVVIVKIVLDVLWLNWQLDRF